MDRPAGMGLWASSNPQSQSPYRRIAQDSAQKIRLGHSVFNFGVNFGVNNF